VNWSTLEGVHPKLADEFEILGIKSLDQLEHLPYQDRVALESRLKAKGIDWDWAWLKNWRSATFGTAPVTGFAAGTGAATANETTQSLSSLVGQQHDPNQQPVFASGVPTIKDDLTLLDGINAIEAEELHQMGIHNFDQLHNLCDDDRHRLKAWFRRRGWYLDMDQWRIASEGNTLNPTLEDIQKKAFEIYQYRDREGRHGAENTDWEQAEWCLRGNPIFDYGVPHRVDYFVEAVDGITPSACDELYRMGLYNLQQIQSLDLESRRLLTRWFAGPRFKVDLTSAFGWLSSLETVPQDKDFGFVFNQRPDQIDDLSDINGIGPATERDLNRIGIYHFNQIAHWSDANVEAIRDTLNLGDRIEKDMWVVQAQRLSGRTN
jgi:predicted flap endonuclease-1-like 5' DNA nuclease